MTTTGPRGEITTADYLVARCLDNAREIQSKRDVETLRQFEERRRTDDTARLNAPEDDGEHMATLYVLDPASGTVRRWIAS